MEWSDELSRGLLEAVPDAILVVIDGAVVACNERAPEIFGAPVVGRSVADLFAEPTRLKATGPRGTVALRGLRRDGSTFPSEVSLSVSDTRLMAVVRDVTERHGLRAEAYAQRQRRLEALGQLAGGVAHDFNNLLGVIVNYANFVIEEAESESPDPATMAADARQVAQAGERGTALTHRLLKFARRDVVRPEVLDLNAVIAGHEEQIRAAAGPLVSLIVRPGEGLPPVHVDRGQLEQVLVSLAANAGDAMPDGGNLVVDTAAAYLAENEHPGLAEGDYVRLRFGDSGRGMTSEVAERAFEPFYTTKPTHEAVGLGLATVYGIVNQSKGDVVIASSPGLGSTLTVLLPAAPSSVADASVVVSRPVSTAGHGETLLVVEDEAALRDVAGRILSGAGYRVLAADGGHAALELAALHEGAIDLLVSDVVMPGMLGKELAERLTGVRPDTRVLYMSGYAQPVLATQGTLDPGVALLEKPFTASDLLSAVRRRLDES